MRYVFSKLAAEEDNSEAKAHADKLVAYLRTAGTADRSTLLTKQFKRHLPADKLDAAITMLLNESPPRVELVEVPRADGRPGKGKKLYRLKEK